MINVLTNILGIEWVQYINLKSWHREVSFCYSKHNSKNNIYNKSINAIALNALEIQHKSG